MFLLLQGAITTDPEETAFRWEDIFLLLQGAITTPGYSWWDPRAWLFLLLQGAMTRWTRSRSPCGGRSFYSSKER